MKKEYIQQLGKIKLGYPAAQDPVSYTDDSTGEFAGMTREIMDRIVEISGLNIQYVALPSGAISYEYLNDNQID